MGLVVAKYLLTKDFQVTGSMVLGFVPGESMSIGFVPGASMRFFQADLPVTRRYVYNTQLQGHQGRRRRWSERPLRGTHYLPSASPKLQHRALTSRDTTAPSEMDCSSVEVQDLIEESRLPHPWGTLLDIFVNKAWDPSLAASHILEIFRKEPDPELRRAALLRKAEDWKTVLESMYRSSIFPPTPDPAEASKIRQRDGNKCCITGTQGRFWDPLVVTPILPIPVGWLHCEPRIQDMLAAFLSPAHRDWWLDYIKSPERMSPLCNHWLVRKSAAKTFQEGLLQLDRWGTSRIEYRIHSNNGWRLKKLGPPLAISGGLPVLCDHSRRGITKVDPQFLETHAQLAASFRWLDALPQLKKNRETLNERPQNRRAGSGYSTLFADVYTKLLKMTRTVTLALWLLVPQYLRVVAYRVLRRIGTSLYHEKQHSIGLQVQRLPFGLYLRFRQDLASFENQFNALQMVHQYTTIPAPQPLDIASIPLANKNKTPFGDREAYLLMTRMPGVPLADCEALLSDEDLTACATQLQDYVRQLRAIPKLKHSKYAICNTLGQSITDTRISWGDRIGPFAGEDDFNKYLRNSEEPSRSGHDMVFTHADLNLQNILVEPTTTLDGRRTGTITGIVDWESCGYYPEYWEYTKSMFEGFRWPLRWQDRIHDIFKSFGDYSKEFEVEERSWGEGIG